MSIVFFATEKTRITVKPDDKIVLERVNIDLRCRAEADSRLELKYYWRRDNAVVQYNSKIEWLEEENVLKISDISVNDAGIYTCVAYTPEPRKSEDLASAKVYVKGLFLLIHRVIQSFNVPPSHPQRAFELFEDRLIPIVDT